MRHLGTLRGSGMIECEAGAVGRADYEFDGYTMKPGEVAGSGEVRMKPPLLANAHSLKGLCLRTDDGQLLSIRFSARWLKDSVDVAHADVYAGLPSEKNWRRA